MLKHVSTLGGLFTLRHFCETELLLNRIEYPDSCIITKYTSKFSFCFGHSAICHNSVRHVLQLILQSAALFFPPFYFPRSHFHSWNLSGMAWYGLTYMWTADCFAFTFQGKISFRMHYSGSTFQPSSSKMFIMREECT